MKIQIPNNFLPERKYIIDTLFSEFLGLDYNVEIYEQKNYKIILEGSIFLEIQDAFWSKIEENETYLHKKNIPQSIITAKNDFFDDEIIIIYGDEKIQRRQNGIYCGIDIFASSFFMLTRWEEAVIEQKDKHGRFPCELSLAQRHNFHYKAIVNEYVEMLWNMLKSLGCRQKRKQRNFEIIPTHDIDEFRFISSAKEGLKHIAGDLWKRKNVKSAIFSAKNLLGFKNQRDIYDTFNFLMEISEKYRVKSHFYFIAGKLGEADVKYNFLNAEVKKTIDKIIQKGHIVGIHGSYSSYDNPAQFIEEISRFKQLGIDVSESRQHYLRLKIPETWRILDNAGIKYDSSIAYTNDSGFRAGVCYQYPVFDIKKRKRLDLVERPLIFMETTTRFKHNTSENFFANLNFLKKAVKKYNGQFVFLWHNSNIKNYYWQKFGKNYETIFK